MPTNHCFRCLTIAPATPRKKGWHSICSDSGHTRCCPTCAAEMGLPAPTQLPERPKKDVHQVKMARRTALNKLVKQGYIKLGKMSSADRELRMVVIDGEALRLSESPGIPGGVGSALFESAVFKFEGLAPDDKPGEVYYRRSFLAGTLDFLIWAGRGRRELQAFVKVNTTLDGRIMLEGKYQW